MDKLQRIKEKLQELVIKSNQARSEEDNPNHSDGFGMYWSGFCNCLKEIIPFVDSLHEEPVSEVKKANEAPEKIYVDTEDRLSDSILYGFTQKRKQDDIEYIRTDAFIEKAKEYIVTHIPDMHTLGTSAKMDECIVKDFTNYLKGY